MCAYSRKKGRKNSSFLGLINHVWSSVGHICTCGFAEFRKNRYTFFSLLEVLIYKRPICCQEFISKSANGAEQIGFAVNLSQKKHDAKFLPSSFNHGELACMWSRIVFIADARIVFLAAKKEDISQCNCIYLLPGATSFLVGFFLSLTIKRNGFLLEILQRLPRKKKMLGNFEDPLGAP